MRTVSVTGHGTATAVPDTALVRVAATHRAATLGEALAGAESARETVVATVATVADLVVSSTDLQVWPSHDQEGKPSGFEARHSLAITCPDLDAAGDLLARLAADVGDRLQVEGVALTVADPTAYAVKAREAAMVDARARAEQLAALAGESLGLVQHVVEGGAVAPGAMRAMAGVAKMADVGLSAGETTIGVTVSVTWDLVD